MSAQFSKEFREKMRELLKQPKPEFGKVLTDDVDKIWNDACDVAMVAQQKADQIAAQIKAQTQAVTIGPPELKGTPVVVLGDWVQLRNEMLIGGIWICPLSAVDGELEMGSRVHTRMQLISNGRLRSLDNKPIAATRTGRSDMIGVFNDEAGGAPVLRSPMPEFAMVAGQVYTLTFDVGFGL